MRILEEACVRTAARFGIEAFRRDGMTGVWTAQGKLVAMGVRFERGVTSHGFAFNVGTELDFFNLIVPCGLAGERVTSLERLTGARLPLPLIAEMTAEDLGTALEAASARATEVLT